MKSKKESISKLSISVEHIMKPLIRQRAESLDLTVSQYIRRLVTKDCGENVVLSLNTE